VLAKLLNDGNALRHTLTDGHSPRQLLAKMWPVLAGSRLLSPKVFGQGRLPAIRIPESLVFRAEEEAQAALCILNSESLLLVHDSVFLIAGI